MHDCSLAINYSVDDWKEKILEHIDADQLPVYWGGTMTGEDGDPKCSSKVTHFAHATKPRITFVSIINMKNVNNA